MDVPLVNDTMMDHPFHLHGFFFQVLAVNGEPPAFRSWEDTVNVPPKATVRIAWVPDDRRGQGGSLTWTERVGPPMLS